VAVPVIESRSDDDNAGAATGTTTLNKPTGTVEGDYLLVIAGDDNSTFSPRGFDLLTGGATWVEHLDEGTFSTDCQLTFQGKFAGASEPSTYTLNSAVSNSEIWASIFRISGVDGTTPVNVVGTATLAGSTVSHVAGEVTTTVDDCLVFAAYSYDGGDAHPTSVSGTGWTELVERTSGTGADDASGAIATKTQSTAGATADCTFGSNVTDGSVSAQIAIAPGGDGSVTVTVPQDSLAETDNVPVVASGVAVPVPQDSLAQVDNAPAVGTSVAVAAPSDTLAQTDNTPAIASGASAGVPHDPLSQTDNAPAANTGASAAVPQDALAQTDNAPTVTTGAPDVTIAVPTDTLAQTDNAPGVASGVNVVNLTDVLSLIDNAPTITAGPAAAPTGPPKFEGLLRGTGRMLH
jgi:hypothetical protein